MNRSQMLLCLLLGTLLLSVVGYNLWAYRCGYCTVASLLSFSAPAVMLTVCNLVIAGILLGLKAYNKKALKRQHCRCGSALLPAWGFCPSCGRQR